MKFEDYGYTIVHKKSSAHTLSDMFEYYYSSIQEDMNNIIVDETSVLNKMNSSLIIADTYLKNTTKKIVDYLVELENEYDKILALKNKDS